jgi:LPXTG-site transpeptidase (sortase) family protein
MHRNHSLLLRHAVCLAFVVCSFILFQANIVWAAEPAHPPSSPTRLMIPSLALDETVVPVGLKEVQVDGQSYHQWLTDQTRVGWHNLSAPLGQIGNTVLNGHSDIHAKVFQNLDQVEIGAEITVYCGNQIYHYVVTEKILVQEKGVPLAQRLENAKLIMPTEDERLTLVTCTQPGATHRLIIISRPLLK